MKSVQSENSRQNNLYGYIVAKKKPTLIKKNQRRKHNDIMKDAK